MNILSQSRVLSTVIHRYFVDSHKLILHYGDCEIYRADKPFCSCGLLHQLNYLDYALAGIVYPKFTDDLHLQDYGKKRRKNKKKDAEAMALLESVFGKIEQPSLESIKYDYDELVKILNKCTTTSSFPTAFKNLTKWLRKSVKRED